MSVDGTTLKAKLEAARKRIEEQSRKKAEDEQADYERKVRERQENRAAYRLRKQTVEPVFGTIKRWMGFTQFLLRGHDKVTGEWRLVTLAYNVKRLWNLKCALQAAI